MRRTLQEQVQRQMDLSRELTDEEVEELIMQEILQFSSRDYLLLEEKLRIQKELFNGIRRLDLLQELIEDPLVTEIMVNGPKDIFVEKSGRLFRWDKQFESEEKLEDLVQQIVSFCNRNISKANPIADARLADGSRVNIVLDPIALNGPVITIRRFPEHPIRIAQLIEWGSVTREAAEFLREAVWGFYERNRRRRRIPLPDGSFWRIYILPKMHWKPLMPTSRQWWTPISSTVILMKSILCRNDISFFWSRRNRWICRRFSDLHYKT